MLTLPVAARASTHPSLQPSRSSSRIGCGSLCELFASLETAEFEGASVERRVLIVVDDKRFEVRWPFRQLEAALERTWKVEENADSG